MHFNGYLHQPSVDNLEYLQETIKEHYLKHMPRRTAKVWNRVLNLQLFME